MSLVVFLESRQHEIPPGDAPGRGGRCRLGRLRGHPGASSSSPSGSAVARAPLPTSPASYLGVYEHGTPGNYQPDAVFTKAVGRQPNLVGYYSGWGEPFKASFAETVHGHGAVTILQMDPTGASVSKHRRG